MCVEYTNRETELAKQSSQERELRAASDPGLLDLWVAIWGVLARLGPGDYILGYTLNKLPLLKRKHICL